MEKKQIGTSDLYVSKVGLGCMSLGTNESHALSIIDEALSHGINYLDTADLYDFGVNEEFVGTAIKQRRKDIILATKVGNRWEQGKEGWSWDPSKSYIKEAVKNSLRRLQTDYIDLYQLHGGTIEDPIDEIIAAFEELKAEGIIRFYGISSIRPNVIREYVNRSNISSVMMQYSVLDRRPEEEMLDYLHEHNVSVIARGPVAKGILTNRALKNKVLEKGYLDYSSNEINKIKSTLEAKEMDILELALQYVLKHPAIAAAVPGASNKQQVQANITAGNSTPLSDELYIFLQQLSHMNKYDAHR